MPAHCISFEPINIYHRIGTGKLEQRLQISSLDRSIFLGQFASLPSPFPSWRPRSILIGLLIYYKLKLILIECLPKSAARFAACSGLLGDPVIQVQLQLQSSVSIGCRWRWRADWWGAQLSIAFEIYDKIYEPHFIKSGRSRHAANINCERLLGKCFPFKLNPSTARRLYMPYIWTGRHTLYVGRILFWL